MDRGPWHLEISLEYSAPPEYGYDRLGLNHAAVRYTSDIWMLELGNLAATFGRGLSLTLFEDERIDFDTKIIGAQVVSNILRQHSLNFIAGSKQEYRFYSPSSDLREPDGDAAYELGGVEFNINSSSGKWTVSPFVIAGRLRSDILWRVYDPPSRYVITDTTTQTMQTLQTGFNQTIQGNEWDIFLEYGITSRAYDYPFVDESINQLSDGFRHVKINPDFNSQGSATYFQLNWYPQWFTAMLEYRRYQNGSENRADKGHPLRQARQPLPWQLGPTGVRQHDISMLANVTHPVDYGNELGWNLEIQTYIMDNLSVLVNATQISQARDSESPDDKADLWPAIDISRNPWQEVYTEIEYTGVKFSRRFILAYTRSVLSGEKAAEIAEHISLVPIYISWYGASDFVFSALAEIQFSEVTGELYTGEILDGHQYRSAHLVASFDAHSKYSFSLIWDASEDPLLNNGHKESQDWLSAEFSVKPLDGMWLRTSYGKEKGGVRCTGGVCRVINPFEGFRMALEWRL